MSLIDALHDVIDEQRKLLDGKTTPYNNRPVLAFAQTHAIFMEYANRMKDFNLVYCREPSALMGTGRGTTVFYLGPLYICEANTRLFEMARTRDITIMHISESSYL